MTRDEYIHELGSFQIRSYGGMTLRDYFAAKALPIANDMSPHGHVEGWLGIARHAYVIADAMIKARTA